MTKNMDAPTPGFALAFTMVAERGAPLFVGEIATGGRRSYVPVLCGSFEGSGLDGRVVGGGETRLERADGVTVVEASYYITFSDGAVARCFGNGYSTRDPDFAGLRLALLFEAADGGGVAELATRAFIAEQPEGSTTMIINRIT